MIKRIIIFGGHIQALGLLRQAKKEGMETILILRDKWSVARFSKCVDEFVVCKCADDLLVELKQFENYNTLLLPTDDEYIEFLLLNYEYLKSKFVLGIPKPDCINIFANKRKTYQFCEENNIIHPFSLYPSSLQEAAEISKKISYPVIIKPAIMYSFHKKFGKKAILCMNSEDLMKVCNNINDANYPIQELIIQEFLDGGAPTLYSFGAFCVNGEPKAWIQANRIRQNPMDFGNSTTFAISCNIPEIEESARKILRLVNYSGMAEVEFMFDPKSNSYKFLEINTRTWKWHTLSEALGFGFLSEMIRYYNDNRSLFTFKKDTKAWVESLTDFTIIIKEVVKGRMNLYNAIASYKYDKVHAVWSLKDPMPMIMYILMSPILYIKRY